MYWFHEIWTYLSWFEYIILYTTSRAVSRWFLAYRNFCWPLSELPLVAWVVLIPPMCSTICSVVLLIPPMEAGFAPWSLSEPTLFGI
jgi:hypothetical protein